MTYFRFGLFALGVFLGVTTTFVGVSDSAPAPNDEDLTTPFVHWAKSKEFVSNGPENTLVLKDKVITGTGRGHLRAYRCKDGASIWTHESGARIHHQPSTDGEQIFFSSANGLTAVNAGDGTKVWNFNSAFCDGPTLALEKKSMVYVGGNDGNLYALDTKTGKQLWTSDFITDAPPDPPKFSGEQARLGNKKARPTALKSDGETLFLSVFDQCRVVAIDAATGKRLWSFQTKGWVGGTAVSTEKYVFFGSQDKFFYCLDKKTGKEIWKYVTNSLVVSGGAVDEKSVYFGSCDGNVYCLNQADGEKRWQFATDLSDPVKGTKSVIYSDPILVRTGVCIAAGEGKTYMINRATGRLIWKIEPSKGSELICSPKTDGTNIFVWSRAKGYEGGEASLVAIGVK